MSEQTMMEDDIEVIRDGDGEITETIDRSIPDQAAEAGDDDDQVLNTTEHDENLVAAILSRPGGQTWLDTLAINMISAVERDERSRKKWRARLADGIKIMGVSAERVGGASFKGASKVVHPVLTEAVVQFQSRAVAELWPPAGPVKSKIVGEATPVLKDQQNRIELYMNWQYTEDMTEAFDEIDMLLFRLPLEGSCFKKQYFDAYLMRTTTRFLTADEVIVSNKATDLESAPRVTVKIKQMPNIFKRYQKLGIYRDDIELPPPAAKIDEDENEIDDAIDDSEGLDKDADSASTDDEIDPDEYLHYETRCELDIPGFEDMDQVEVFDPATSKMKMVDDKPSGIAVPYIVTVNVDHTKILSIVRNWDVEDPLKRREQDLVHYKYLPGFGFYGYGLLHTIGSLSEAATGALRALLDSAQFSNMQGGFKSKQIKLDGKGEIVIAPGQWVDLSGSFDDIRKALIPLPYKEPSEALFKLLGALVEYAQRFASTTESMVGDANNNGPVGTTVALIEQGSKVFSAIHKRCHNAMGKEFKQIAKLNSRHIPEEGVTFNYRQASAKITREDFSDRIDISPVSDPNISSQTQRIAQAQAVKQLAEADKTGKRYDAYEVDKNLLEAMRVPDINRYLKDPNKKPPSMSPLIENMAMVQGKPVQAYMHQDHKAHMMAHEMFFMGIPPELQKAMQGAHLAHKAEHIAMLYFIQTQALAGVELPVPPQFDDDEAMEKAVLPPEVENKIAQITVKAGEAAAKIKEQQAQAQQAQAAAQQAQQQAQQQQADPKAKLAEAENARAQESHEQELRHAEEDHEGAKRQQKSEQFEKARAAADGERPKESMFAE